MLFAGEHEGGPIVVHLWEVDEGVAFGRRFFLLYVLHSPICVKVVHLKERRSIGWAMLLSMGGMDRGRCDFGSRKRAFWVEACFARKVLVLKAGVYLDLQNPFSSALAADLAGLHSAHAKAGRVS